MRPIRLSLALAAMAAALGIPAAAQTPAPDPSVSLATFDTAWTVIGRTHFDSTYNGVDWNALRAELRPRAGAARSTEELRGVLNEMLGRLRQSHFYLVPGEVQRTLSAGEAVERKDGDAGLDLRLVDGRFLVTRVEPGGAAEAAGVKTGWVVEQLGAKRAAEVLASVAKLPGDDPRTREMAAYQAMAGARAGAAGSPLAAVFRDGRDRRVPVTLVRTEATGEVTRYGNLPEMRVQAGHRLLTLDDGTRVGVIRFNLWMPVASRALDQAVDALRDADGIVVDLRGNFGGVGFMAAGFAGHFIDRPDTLATQVMRTQKLFYVANPRRVDTQARPVRPYAGPVAVLTDALSVSTSEFFAGGMQKLGRARVFGETTAGQALPAAMQALPNGDVLVHAIADFTGPGGTRFEGAGVVPDVAAPPTRAALLAGHDPALDAATAWIRAEKK
jgi:carboxyl-terminal processing protease